MAVNRVVAGVAPRGWARENGMIDGLGRASPPRLALTGNEAAARASVAPSATPRTATTGAATTSAATTSAGQVVRDMAASAPVDTARVAALRLAIAAGSYKPDPQAIAAKMIALEAGSV